VRALIDRQRKSMPETKGFFQYGEHDTDLNDSSYEDFLVADRSGLEHLRSKIDEVLEGADEVPFSDERFVTDLNGIRIAARQVKPPREGKWDGVATVGCYSFALCFAALMILGIWKAVDIITGNQ
jgi:hypothetical protein